MLEPTPRRHLLDGSLPSAGDLRSHLHRLFVERLEARAAASDAAYMADLEDEIDEVRTELVGARVIDLARRRAAVAGRQSG